MAKVKKSKKETNLKKGDNFLDSLVDVTEYEEPLITTIWGRPGSGKTATAATWPKPILLLDIMDKGAESANGLNLKKGDIMVKRIETWEELEEAVEWVEDNPTKFKTIILDHMTNAQELGKYKLLQDNGRSKMTQPMFGELSGMMKDIIRRGRALIELGMYPVFIAEDRTDQVDTEDDEVILDPNIGPALQPAVQSFLVATSKIVGRQYISIFQEKRKVDGKPKMVEVKEYRLGIGPNPYYQTKIRKPRGSFSPDYIVNPDFATLWSISKGTYENPEEKTAKKKKKKK